MINRSLMIGSTVLAMGLGYPLSASADAAHHGATCSITGTAWNDGDGTGHGDGQIGSGEGGVEGVTAQLLRPDGGPVGGSGARQTTDAHGGYAFTDLPCGAYRVAFPHYQNDQFTTPNVGNPATASTALPDADGTGITGVYRLGKGRPTVQRHVNAGLLEAESGNMQKIGDRVWNDANGNGLQDPGERGVPGVAVTLVNPDGSSAGEGTKAVTNSDGRYIFTTLNIGTYRVRFSGLPKGFHFTKPNAGKETIDSDALPASAGATTADTADVFVGSYPDTTENRDIDAGIHTA
ncbi:MAG TPA: SdrD B-like domain-containing protein [Streptosporangiaceae bacterium]